LGLEIFGSFYRKQIANLACESSSFYPGLGTAMAEIDSIADENIPIRFAWQKRKNEYVTIEKGSFMFETGNQTWVFRLSDIHRGIEMRISHVTSRRTGLCMRYISVWRTDSSARRVCLKRDS